MEPLLPSNKPGNLTYGFNKKIAVYIFAGFGFLVIFYCLFLRAPADFPVGTTVRIERGSSLRSISSLLKREHIIRSRTAFESFVIIFGGEKHIVSADYSLEDTLSVWQVAKRLSGGGYFRAQISVTIPEGFNTNQIADVFALKLTAFNKANFLLQTSALEGYLFPDTYFFLTTDNEKNVIESMNDNFQKKISLLLPQIASSGKTEKDIIIMASIIEKEAQGDIDRGFISGILWKRISIGMPLQVDAAMETYKAKGLPKAPIGNPGIEAILASIHPQKSPYLYYLHDKNGTIHYAKTFAEHKSNEEKYLIN